MPVNRRGICDESVINCQTTVGNGEVNKFRQSGRINLEDLTILWMTYEKPIDQFAVDVVDGILDGANAGDFQ